ncbi:MAG: tetratricopeptide repeat protein [Myxococcales bacterium]|nr:tetratricopeptide repeat protein [Myxococcales bacterium]
MRAASGHGERSDAGLGGAVALRPQHEAARGGGPVGAEAVEERVEPPYRNGTARAREALDLLGVVGEQERGQVDGPVNGQVHARANGHGAVAVLDQLAVGAGSEPEAAPRSLRVVGAVPEAVFPSEPTEPTEPEAPAYQLSAPEDSTAQPETVAEGASLAAALEAAVEDAAATDLQVAVETRASRPEVSALDDGFFDTPPPPAELTEEWDSLPPPPPMNREARLAMWASAAILVVSLIGIGSYEAYHRLVVPEPVELGAGGPLGAPEIEPIRAAEEGPEPMAQGEVEPLPAAQDAEGAEPAVASATDEASDGPGEAAEADGEPTQAVEPEAPDAPEAVAAAGVAAVPGADAAAAAAVVSEAEALFKKGDHKAALAAYERALALDSGHALALSRSAFIQLNRGRKREAAELAGRAVAIDPKNSEAWIVLGAARGALGDRAGAREAYGRCAEGATGEFVVECRRMARR